MPATKEIRAQLKRFGANVRRERYVQGLTQQQFAELVDLNVRTVQKIEAGEINILITTLLRIQRALRCRCGKLVEGEETERRTSHSAGRCGLRRRLSSRG